jgi:hypothetical protein
MLSSRCAVQAGHAVCHERGLDALLLLTADGVQPTECPRQACFPSTHRGCRSGLAYHCSCQKHLTTVELALQVPFPVAMRLVCCSSGGSSCRCRCRVGSALRRCGVLTGWLGCRAQDIDDDDDVIAAQLCSLLRATMSLTCGLVLWC